MRTLILGGGGMLGLAVVREARRRQLPALALGRAQADVRDPVGLRRWCAEFHPEVVINCAAYTKVDLCEGEGQAEAMAVNGDAVGTVAAAAAEVGARLVQPSTDYVFDGAADEPYREDAATAPLSVYGRSKLVGEQRALAAGGLVVRTSWLFGTGGPNFVATVVRLIDGGERPLRIVDDQVGAPTYTPFLASALLDLATAGASGTLHYRNYPPASWYAFASEIARAWPTDRGVVEVRAMKTAELARPAPRPAYSVLSVERCEAILGRTVEPWLAGLSEYLSELHKGRSR
jgi:dTDP-4-dehydrorhamnose reductase